ncbi:MAG: hypothetical protein IT243_05255 [Bacteroidia bacterium]|nr:hypothetical protein [Bacteroidia bacterium]
MKKNYYSQILTILFALLCFFNSSNTKAQTIDTTLFDYDINTGCNVCGDLYKYNSYTLDSILDATSVKKFIGDIQVKLKFFSCYTGPLYLYLNGNLVDTKTIGALCSCNSCDSVLFNISNLEIIQYYNYGQKNYFSIQTPGSYLYMDRATIYRYKYDRYNYDAGISSVDSPLMNTCQGSKNIKIRAYNNGKKQLSSLTVDWKWNGASQSSASLSGTLDTIGGIGSNNALINLGSKTFTTGKIDTLKAWTKNPGGVIDSFTYNDTTNYLFYGSYSDTITVGGTSPMFSTVQSAVTALMTYGVCGPTFVKIRPGTYSEQIVIGAIPGTNSTNTVTFLSSNLDSSSVVISYNSTSSSYNYTVSLFNTSNIIFHKVTLRSLSTTYSRVLYLFGNIENIQFHNCYINAPIVTSTSTSRCAIYRSASSGESTKNIVINNCLFNGGSYNIYLYNSNMKYLDGFYVRNSIFQNPYYTNINCYYAKNIDIKNNKLLKSNTSYTYGGNGIYFNGISDSMRIRENRIIHENSGNVIYLSNVIGLSTKRMLIYNNFISAKNINTNGVAIYFGNCYYIDFVFNNVLSDYIDDSYSLEFDQGKNIKILNNNLINDNDGKVFNINSSGYNSIEKSNNNNYYNNGDVLGLWYGNSIENIDDLKSIGFDSSSVSGDPNYSSSSDLHSYSVDIESNAKPYSGISKDIDEESRNSTKPDIGADEFKLVSHDAGIVDRIKVTPGTKCMKVVLRNFGKNNLTSVKIDWKLNGVSKTQVSWTGSLAKGDTDIVCLGNVTFQKDSLYELIAWTSQPNTVSDSIVFNDTLETDFYTSLNGIYTIGGTSPDFATFTDAVSALNNGGIIDSAYFKVRNGTYTEQFEIENIDGAKNYNDVVFESENKDSNLVTLQYGSSSWSNNFVIKMTGAKGVTFRKMKLQNYSSLPYNNVVNIGSFSKYIRFENNIITSNDSTNNGSESSLIYINENKGSDFYISQNIFNKGYSGIYIYGNWDSYDRNLIIHKNIFKKQGFSTIYLYNIKNFTISENKINETQSTLFSGLYIYSTKGTNYINNNIININNSNANYGVLYSTSEYMDTDTIYIYNNMVSLSSNNDDGQGMYLYDINYANVFYNSILTNCTDSSSQSSACYITWGNYKIYNNNFIHNKNGYSYYVNGFNTIKSNYNNLNSNGTKYVYFDGNAYSNLNSYSSTENIDTNSIDKEPFFNSNTDLHTSNPDINGKARVVNLINKDIDGETRNTSTPDIGADEFTPPARDASLYSFFKPGELFKADSSNFEFIIKNMGTDTIKNVTVKVKINNDTLPRKQFVRTFATGDTIHVKMGKKYYLHKDSVYNFTAWTSLPNGSADNKPSNDTLKRTNCRTALSGVYTIGGTSPDFATFTAAVNALKQRGIMDSVRFRVRTGTYTEQIRIPQIAGATKRNSIVFESQNKDTTSVILTYASAYWDTNYVVYLDGADGVTFRYMTLAATSTYDYNQIFKINNGANNNTIYKNVLEAPNTNLGTTDNAIIFSDNSADNDLLIKENHIKNGDYAIYLSGIASPYEKNLEISGNHFLNQYENGINLYYGDSINISNNYMYSDKNANYYGIYLQYIYNKIKLNSNILKLENAYNGLFLYYCGNYFKRGLISNNAIYCKNNYTTNYGIYSYYSNYIDYIHNTVKIECSNTSSIAFNGIYGNYNTFFNNILTNNSGYCIFLNGTSTFTNLNYNNYFTGGLILGYYNSSNANSLSAWKTLCSKDTFSLSVNPLYYSSSNLHVKEVSLNGAAKYFNTVPLDFDGQTRNISTPDIGADEFDLPTNDAGISQIIVPKKPFPADSQWVKVVLKNYGSNAITSVSIDWKFNGTTQTTKSWTGTLNSGDTVHVKLLKKKFISGTPYSTKVWTTNPNSSTDPENTNDTNEVINQYPAMSGVYTIGGSSPDFATFTDAVNAMKLGGIIDSVRFDVRSGNYNEQFRIPKIVGATNENSIIFQSEGKDSSLVSLYYTAPNWNTNWVVRIDSASGVTFRYMKIKASNSSYSRLVVIYGESTNIRVHNCNLMGYNSTSTSDYNSILYINYDNSNYPSINNIKIYKNRFSNGSYGILSSTYSSAGYGRDLKVFENNFENQHYTGLYIAYSKNLYIHKNNIYHTSSYNGYSSGYGIYLYYINEGFTITSNKIYNQEYYGIYTYNSDATINDTSLIANNFIHVRSNNSVYGIFAYSSDYLNVFYNNINLISTNANSRVFYIEYSYNIRVNNNNFINTGNGYSFNAYSGSFISCNYNNFYSNGSTWFNRSGTNYSTISDWRTATGYDINSITINPDYVSSTDLHTEKIELDGKARNIKYLVKYDIDEQKRDSIKPDIGADEYIPAAIDAGVSALKSPGTLFNASTYDVIAIVKNFGTDTIKNIKVKGKINNDTFTRKLVTRNIKTGDTIHVKLGSFSFHKDSTYNMYFWTFDPNSTIDEKSSNDTLDLLNKRTALSGVYTIGGTSPDFATFKSALYALKTRGILDSVRFRVRSGTYTEQMTIPSIEGAYKKNSIIFESENQDTASVTLQYNSTYSDSNYVVLLNGADGFTFRYLKIKSLSSSNKTRIFYLIGGADNNTIYKNILEGRNTSWSSTDNALIFSNADADNYLQIKDNHIKEGDYSIFLNGYPSNSPYLYEKGLEISGNKLLNPYYMGINLEKIDTVDLSSNYIYMDKYSYGYGMYLYQVGTNFIIHRNILNMKSANYGIMLYYCGTSYKNNYVTNNSIYLKNTSTNVTGIYTYNCNYIYFIHNSFNLESSNSSSSALKIYYGSNNSSFNNNIVNTSGGYAYFVYNSSYFTSNYNNIYSTGSNLAYWNGTNISSLASWETTSGLDANSISVDPLYKASNNLHVKEMTLNGAGIFFNEVPLDFDYEERDSITPDIGADEFDLPSNDAGVSQIILPSIPYPADSQYVKVAFKNYGGNTLYQVSIAWTLNSAAQSPITWTGTLLSGDTVHVKLKKMYFAPYTNYSTKVWTYSPNGASDGGTSNDTLQNLNQQPALSGVYTIGGASPDFATFNDAVTAMKNGGIIDSVRFDVRNGTYYEQVKIPYIKGANKENAIIFQSEAKDSSKVYLIGTPTYSDNYVVKIDSVNGVTLRYMTILTTLPYNYNRIIDIYNNAKNINIHDCNLIGKLNTNTNENEAVIYISNNYSNSSAFDKINIYRNSIINGSYGIIANGNSNYNQGKDLKIYSNIFNNQYYSGIFNSYSKNTYINQNILYNTVTPYSNNYGIQLYYIKEGFTITNNKIINNNRFGVYIYDCDGATGDSSLVANNFIHVGTNNNTYGVYASYCEYMNFFNNNISITSSNSSSYAAYFNDINTSSICNNIFYTSGTGYAFYSYYGGYIRCNFNNFYTTGTNLMNRNGISYTTLSAWTTATSWDNNSINIDPDYVSSTDLHVRGTDLDGKGRNHKYIITKDIDDQPRNTTKPDIGADEFDIPSPDDAGILSYISPVAPFAAGSIAVKVVIKNFGSDSLKSATIKWKVNGTLQSSKSWTGKLKTGQTDTVDIGNFNFLAGKENDLIFWTTDPNGKSDTTEYNDTLYKNDVMAGLKGVYSVSGTLPDFNDLGAAFNALKIGGVSDTVWFKIRTGTYTINYSLDQYLGSSPNSPIYIESASGDSSDVILNRGGNSDYIIMLNGADYIKFRKLTFVNNYGNSVNILNKSQDISFENCYFNINPYWWYSTYGIFSGSSADDSLTVKNCRFDNGTYGMYLYGYPVSGSILEKNHKILNNVFNNCTYAIKMHYINSPIIKNNYIKSNVSTSTSVVEFYYTQNELEFSYNKIIKQNASDNSGLSIFYHSGNNTNRAKIYNNFISSGGSSYSKCVYIYNSNYINFYHNSLNQYGIASPGNSIAFHLIGGSNFDIKNNVISNIGGGYAYKFENSPSTVTSDYNDIYTSGTNIGNISGTDYTNLAAWKTATSKETNSISYNPNYTTNIDLHSNLAALDSACLYLSSVPDDIDGETRNSTNPDIGADEFQSLPINLGVVAILKPENTCGLDSTYIKLKIFNFGNQQQVNYPIKYQFGNSPNIKTATISDTIKPGQFYECQFTQKEAVPFNTALSIKVWTDLTSEQYRLNDSSSVTFTNYSVPDSVKSMMPSNNSTGVDMPFTLSWLPSTGATKYDIYVWDTATSRPLTPTVSNTTQISYQFNSGFNYGTTYYWQIIAKNPICNTEGKVQMFTMRHLPDLLVNEVNGPHSAFSGTSITVTAKIKNIGLGATNNSWYDVLYLSSDSVWDVSDQQLGSAINSSALNPSQSYNNTFNVNISNGVSGNYYLIVFADKYGYLGETNNNNNSRRDTGKIKITLTPPPDLQVTSVSRPSIAFSGSTVNMTYIVKNKGTGDTKNAYWLDRIYLSTEKVVNGGSYNLKTTTRTANLKADSTYQVFASVTIPNYISGKYFFVVYTDANNYEYEYAFESNNTKGSDTIEVKMTPPPDLIVRNVELNDSVSNSESVNIKYNIINDGGTSTNSLFYDQLFVCPTSTFDLANSTYIGQVYHSTLASKDTSKVNSYFDMPKSLNGKYYFFVFTDYWGNVNEVSNEGNNMSLKDSVYIFSPDMIVTRILINSTDSTGSTTPIKWTVKNNGKGNNLQGHRCDSIFMSKQLTWNRSQAKALGRYCYTSNINIDDTLQLNTIVTIPDGYDGKWLYYIFADADENNYEWTKENNNISRSTDSMDIILSPYPDLKPTVLDFPDSAEAGQLVGLNYKVKNQGTNKANPNWKDKFYLSKDSVWDPTKVIELTSVTKSSILKKDSTYTSAVYFTLPTSIIQGNYYYWVFTDAVLDVYEHFNDSNNKARSGKAFIDGYPPVDLKISCPVINKDTLYSGSTYTLTFTVTNIGDAITQTGFWVDGFYLSTDSILSANDIQLTNINRIKKLEEDSSYTVNTTFKIPNGTEGNYYLIAKTDIDKSIYDIDTTNNKKVVCKNSGGAKLTVINLTPPPDLQITSWKVPSTATSGQNLKIVWKVENKGSGNTLSGSWTDQFYLSTDYTISLSDFRLGNKTHSGNINSGSSYLDSAEYTIPINITGNYIVLLKTDDANEVYEHNSENNNLVSSITTISQAPPADLIVTYITAPDSVIVGETINVNYKVKNVGSNPAIGWLRDNIYLSEDNIQDASDLLLSTEQYYLSIAPGSDNLKSKSIKISGVALGDYYLIAYTDIMNNINEVSNTNNDTASVNTMNVNVPILPLNTKTGDSLNDNDKLYYRIIIADSLEGETMLLTLKGDSINGNNEMYLRYDEMASASIFDFKHGAPFKGNQELLVPELKKGTYYLYVTGNTTASYFQKITLYPRILPFEVRKVSPSKGGDKGEITVLIEGSKFTEETEFLLIDTLYGGGSIMPSAEDRNRYSSSTPLFTNFIDPTKVYATFNLTGKKRGFYHIYANKESETAILNKGFKIEAGVAEDLSISMNRPGNTRRDMILYWDIVFGNSGNSDIVNKKVKIVSSGGAPIAFDPNDLTKKYTELEVVIEGDEGPPNRLGPGAVGSVRIYTKSSAALGITIIK